MYIGRYHKYKIAGICVAGIQDDHLSYIINSVTNALNAKGFKTIIYNAFSDFYNETPYTKGEESIYHLLNFKMLDVLIILPETIKCDRVTDFILNAAKRNGVPVISLDHSLKGCTNILYDYKPGFEEVVRHMIEHHNCRDPFFISGIKGNPFAEERFDIYKKVLAENGIEFKPERMGYGDFWGGPTREIMEQLLLSTDPLPDCIICANDAMAIAVSRFLRDRGYTAPDDVLVSGFDSTYQERVFYLSGITSAMLDVVELSSKVADAAQGYFDKTEHPSDKYVSFSLKIANSCGCSTETRPHMDEDFYRINDYNMATQANEAHISLFMTNTVGCNSLESISDAMTRFAAKHSWVCIKNNLLDRPESIDSKEVFTEHMLSLIQRDGKEAIKNVSFKTSNLVPDIGRALKKYNKLMVTPLNFLSEVLGYYVVVTDGFQTGYNYYNDARRFVGAANQILQNFKINYNLQKAYNRLEMTQEVDPLTHLYNRKGYFACSGDLIEKNHGKYFMVISADMDYLKEINDTYGHDEGDAVLKAMAGIVRELTGKNGICARFGGDEFVITEPCDDPRVFSARKAEQLQDAIDEYNRSSGKEYQANMSMGVFYGMANTTEELAELIRRADNMMYEQKRNKKDRGKISSGFTGTGTEMNYYEKRIHSIFAHIERYTYFYMNYVTLKWHVIPNDETPEFLINDNASPIRALWASDRLHEDDRPVLHELITKIKKSFEKKLEDSSESIHVRIMTDGEPVWYQIMVVMIADESGRMSELAGIISKDTPEDIMKLELENYYTTTDNPLMINEQIKQKINRKDGKPCAIIQFDIKRFKFINEKHGEEAGTQLLYNITRKLKLFCNNEQLSARLNSDIFMLVTPYDSVEDIYNIIYDIEERMSEFRGMRYEFVFGVYLIDDITLEPRLMGDRAAIARASVKNNAIENIAFYDQKMLMRAQNRRFVESNMNKALANQEFIIYLQPKFSISRKEAVGYEALVRWIHPERGMISPGDFIPLFEENGFVRKLDEYVWECACQVLHDWMDRGFEPLPISVNVSRAHLKDDHFIEVLDGLVEKYNIPKELLELEITESLEGNDTNAMTQEVKNRGYTLLMDDFGSGYSSLNTLKSTRFDVLKIDREFLSSFMIDERGKKIISHTITMSQDVGLDLIAEGVETEEQAEFLSKCGCDIAQGFFYARPMPVQDAEDYLKKPDKRVFPDNVDEIII